MSSDLALGILYPIYACVLLLFICAIFIVLIEIRQELQNQTRGFLKDFEYRVTRDRASEPGRDQENP